MAHADGSPVTLTWIAPAECPDSASVLREVMRIAASGRVARRIQAQAVVSQTPNGKWSVTIKTSTDQGDHGERSIRNELSCETLASATALVLALAVNAEDPLPPSPRVVRPVPVIKTEPPKPPEQPQPKAVVVATPPPPIVIAPKAIPTLPSRSTHLALALTIAGDVGALPTVNAGASVAMAWTPGHWRVELGGILWVPQIDSLSSQKAQGGRLSMTTANARLCYGIKQKALEIGPCAIFEVNNIAASGRGSDVISAGNGAWIAAGAGILTSVRFSREIALRLSLDLVVPCAHPEFVIDGGGTVSTVSVVDGRLGFGFETRFF